MRELAVSVDLDWASEAAVENLLDFLEERRIPVTVFVTHRSARVESVLGKIEVGLHPFFGVGSSHGETVNEVVRHVLELPHNLPAFRCHRFAVSNESREALVKAGLKISSNVCADLEFVPAFRERCGLVEVPIFLEDGGFLRCGHSLNLKIEAKGPLVLLVHPMHFAVNTPHFGYMTDIKQSTSREAWNTMTSSTIEAVRWRGRGIRDFIMDLLDSATHFTTIGQIAQTRLRRA